MPGCASGQCGAEMPGLPRRRHWAQGARVVLELLENTKNPQNVWGDGPVGKVLPKPKGLGSILGTHRRKPGMVASMCL